MAAIITVNDKSTSLPCEILRRNLARAYDALHLVRGQLPYLRMRGAREWEQYALHETAHTVPVGGARFLPLRLKGLRGENVTELCEARDAPALVGWSATRFAMLSRDPATALWRVCAAWPLHFVGFRLARLVLPAHVPTALLSQYAECAPDEHASGAVLYLEHPDTGLVRFEMP